jgi:hypothetical protein
MKQHEEHDMNWEKVTLESLQENRPDVIETLAEEARHKGREEGRQAAIEAVRPAVPTEPMTEEEFLNECSSVYNTSEALQDEFRDRDAYVAYMSAAFTGKIKPEDTLADARRSLQGRVPVKCLEVTLGEAAKAFDADPELRREFAACSDPRGTWLAFVKSEHQRKSRHAGKGAR